MPRYEHAGAAKPTTLANTVVSGDTTVVGTDLTGWPTGATGPFWFCLDAGNAGEEKCLATTRTGNTLNSVTRGQDSSTATGHSAGVTLTHIFSALEADQDNAHVNASTGVHGITGAVVGTTDSQTLTNKLFTSPGLTDNLLKINGGTFTLNVPGGSNDTLLTGGSTNAITNKDLTSTTNTFPWSSSWTSYTPSFTNVTSFNGGVYYKQLGKVLYLRGAFLGGTATVGPNTIGVGLPGGLTSAAQVQPVTAVGPGAATTALGYVASNDTKVTLFKDYTGATFGAGNSLVGVAFSAVIEVQ